MEEKIRKPMAEMLFGKGDPEKPYCAFNCDNPSHEFRDELSRKEFRISGICQNCQDEVFGGPDDE